MYKLEWIYENGKIHSTSCNTLEIAEEKANIIKLQKDVFSIIIIREELIKIIK